jgi:hypothetical protein
MSWYEQFQGQWQNTGQVEVKGISGIPFKATPQDRFCLNVDVEQVFERETKAGEPCYFLHCRDTEGIKFSIVCWEWQWARLQGRAEEGAKLEVVVRVPKEGYSAFTLA